MSPSFEPTPAQVKSRKHRPLTPLSEVPGTAAGVTFQRAIVAHVRQGAFPMLPLWRPASRKSYS